MAARTESRPDSNRSTTSRSRGSSAFSWGSTGAIAGVALGGAALAIAANIGRKLAIQGVSASAGSWFDSLAAEHEATLALFDKMLATDDSQTVQRRLLLMKLGHALDKHAYAEEHVVYAALRENDSVSDAAKLESDHGEVKEFLYRLSHMAPDASDWIATVSEFRASVAAHAKLEEDVIFPQLRADIDAEMDARLTKEVNKAGFMMA